MKIEQSKLISVEIDSSDPLYLQTSDTPNDVLVSMKLRGTNNYLQWSQAMSMCLHSKNKFGFVDGTIPIPSSKDDPDFPTWKLVNQIVLSWLVNTIHIDLIPTTKITTQSAASELWTYLVNTFSRDDNIMFFNLQRDVSTLKQGNDSLLVYFKKSNKIWHDLSFLFRKLYCSCESYNNNEVHGVMYFLMGLHENYEWFRRKILSTYPLLQVDEVYALVLQVERMHHHHHTISPQISSSYDKDENHHVEEFVRNEPDEAFYNVDAINNWHCAYCHNSSHTIDLCYDLNGYPSYPKHYFFTHNHPLEFSSEIKGNNVGMYCNGCGLILVNGPNYSCKDCNFMLHKSCTEIPHKTIYYPGHPQHPLNFLMAPVYGDGGIFKCDGCGNIGQGFHFHCSICSYDLHLHCAQLPNVLEHHSHPHQLNLHPSKNNNYKGSHHYCNACSGECLSMTYSCIKCQFFLHPSCASLPRYISFGQNCQFTLSLMTHYSTGSGSISHNQYCNFCGKIPSQENWFYYCKDSGIFAHLDCGAVQALAPNLFFNDLKNYDGRGFKEYVELYVKGVHMQGMQLQEYSSRISQNVEKVPENLPLEQELKHEHTMVLIMEFDIPTNYLLCTWCHQPLSSAVYGCQQCKFFVHKICYEAPRKITHNFHLQHPLILLPRIPRQRKWCTACDNLITGTVFSCKPCGLFLHPECALLPQETRYERHFHKVLNLVYEIEGEVCESDEHYCQVCELRLYEKWAYQCAHCEYIAHLACMVPLALPSRKNDGKEETGRHKSKLASEPKKIN